MWELTGKAQHRQPWAAAALRLTTGRIPGTETSILDLGMNVQGAFQLFSTPKYIPLLKGGQTRLVFCYYIKVGAMRLDNLKRIKGLLGS